MKRKMEMMLLIAGMVAMVCLLGCASASGAGEGTITSAPFGTTPDGTKVDIFTLKNASGMEARICNYGGLVVSLKTPDRNGHFDDVVLGYDDLDNYIKRNPFFGALVGRFANRIAKAKFTLDGKTYTLAANHKGINSLHGGLKGFDKQIWKAQTSVHNGEPSLELTYFSKDGEEGYPGNLNVKATYTVTKDNALRLDYTATTDEDTVVNFSHHSYFNLATNGGVLNHEVMINADKFTPVDSTLIPTGELRPVAGTPFDFRTPHKIGERINDADEQLKIAGGYDHNWVINKHAGELAVCARVTEPTSGRVMEVLSTEPGLQFYSGNFLDGTITGKGGKVYHGRAAFCMEPQHFPDSPNQPNFPSTVLKPGQVFHSTIEYRFSAK
jgi:aldose 1-epimerase